MSRKTKLILSISLLALLSLAIFNDSLRAKMFLLYNLRGTGEDGLVGYWPLDGDAKDKSGNENDGTLTSGPTASTGKVSGAIHFDGVDDYVITSASTLFALTGDFTVSLWFNADDFGIHPGGQSDAENVIISFGTENANGPSVANSGMMFYCSDASCAFYGDNSDAWNVVSFGSDLSTATWYNLVVTKSGNTITAYKNGNSQNTLSLGAIDFAESNPQIRIGERFFSVGGHRDFMQGSVDEVRVYNRALTESQIKTYYDATSGGHLLPTDTAAGAGGVNRASASNNVLTSGLVGHWTFDGPDTNWATGQTNDISGNGNNGSLIGNATSTAPVTGIHGQGLKFDGSNDYVDLGTSNTIRPVTGDFSVSAWFNSQDTSGGQTNIIGDRNTGNVGTVEGWYLAVQSNGKINAELEDSGFDYKNYETADVVDDQQWHHATFTWSNSGQSLKIYIDGVEGTVVVAELGTLGDISPTTNINIGRRPNNAQYFNGSIDDVRIYNRALSASEVQQLYDLGAKDKISVNSGAATNNVLTSGLVGHWTFDGPDLIQNATDRSGNGNNGFLTNMATSTAATPGIHGQGLKFDGVDDYISAGDSSTLIGNQSGTISAWINVSPNAGTDNVIVAYGGDGTDLSVQFAAVVASGAFKVSGFTEIFDGTGNNKNGFNSNTTTFTLGQWHHLVLTSDGSAYKIYVDGASEAFTLTTGNNDGEWFGDIATSANDLVSIGMRRYEGNNSFFFNGSLDDVRIYNRALSASEVQQLYNLGR